MINYLAQNITEKARLQRPLKYGRYCRMFSHHLKESGKSYGEHFMFAMRAGFLLLWAGVASIVHAFIPGLFPFVSQRIVMRLAEASRRQQQNAGTDG
jgi:hypothetical protein